jgi:hypothetical protein
MERLFPDKQIKKEDFSGILMIEGDLRKNCLQFSFMFDKLEMLHPLLIWIKTTPLELAKNGSKEYRKKYACNVRDINNPVMKTHVLFPRFLIERNEILVSDVTSQVGWLNEK